MLTLNLLGYATSLRIIHLKSLTRVVKLPTARLQIDIQLQLEISRSHTTLHKEA